MTAFESFLVWIAQVASRLYIKGGIYKTWSKIYQFIWERQRRPLQKFESLEALVEYVKKLKWRADSWRQLWDAFSAPEHVQWIAETTPDKFIGDCDEFAIYQAAVIAEQGLGRNEGVLNTYVMTVMWYQPATFDAKGKYGGHNVCLLELQGGKWAYMDYGFPSAQADSLGAVAGLVLKMYAPNARLIAWARSDRDLTSREFSTTIE